MASNGTAERALAGAVTDLHDYLWTHTRVDQAKLLHRLEVGARVLDRHLGTEGAIWSAVRPLLRDFQPATTGPDLFSFLRAVTSLTAAAGRVRRKPNEAAKHASELAVSLAIHLASSVDRFDLVEAFESGRTDFAQFSADLTEALENRGVLRAGEFGRAINLAFDVNALWDKEAGRDEQCLRARAAVCAVALACAVLVDGLRSLGRYRETPYRYLAPVTERILRRAL